MHFKPLLAPTTRVIARDPLSYVSVALILGLFRLSRSRPIDSQLLLGLNRQ